MKKMDKVLWCAGSVLYGIGIGLYILALIVAISKA
jgi:tetrahydromethanopterin S-methyltransferase subunit G